ncbi:hypothetical protein A2U01_0110331, partial [Trifolium medium]|nr:hypothetical protein [Trifolium medium]
MLTANPANHRAATATSGQSPPQATSTPII